MLRKVKEKIKRNMTESIAKKRLDEMSEKSEIRHRLFLVNTIRRFTKIQKNKIVFLNFSGNYDCNVKYIAQEIRKRGLDYELVFGTFSHNKLDGLDNFPSDVHVVIRDSFDFYHHLASARVIFDNSINLALLGYKKKHGQTLIETWHGAMGIKMFGPEGNDDVVWHNLARKEAKQTNFIISNSDLEDLVYRRTFWQKTKILQYGHPRNDVLFQDSKELKTKICNRYSIPLNHKLCLYAPTFRDDHNQNIFMIDVDNVKNALAQKFGGEWTILFKHHDGMVRTYWDKLQCPKGVTNVSDYPDIQELMSVIDAGITDYSSWICEYMLRKKPGFLFAPDYKQYINNERTLLMPLEDYPFPLTQSEEELAKVILNFDDKKYQKQCDEFMTKHKNVDDGSASKKVVDFIQKL